MFARTLLTAVSALLGAVVAAEFAYIALANPFLALVVPRLVGHSGRADVDWTRAWTVWPGRVELRGVEVTVESIAARWALHLDRASVDVDLFALGRLELRVGRLRGDGLAFRLRSRIRDLAGRAVGENVLPEVRDLPGEPPAQPRRGRWTYMLADVAVERVAEIWIEEYRWRGDGRLSGTLFRRSPRRAELAPARLDVARGALRLGDDLIARTLAGSVEAAISPFDPLRERGKLLLDHLDGRLGCRGELASLGFLNFYLGGTDWIELGRGEGALSAEVRVRRGQFAPDSRFEVESRSFGARIVDLLARGPGRARWTVSERAGEPVGEVELVLGRFEMARVGRARPEVRGDGLRVSGRSRSLRVDRAFTDLETLFEMPRATIPDLTIVNDYLPPDAGLAVTAGSARVSARLAAPADGPARGEFVVKAEGLAADAAGARARCAVEIDGRVEGVARGGSYRLDGTRLRVRSLDLVAAGDADAAVADWWADTELERAVLRVDGAPRFEARLRMALRDSGPVVALFAARRPLSGLARRLLTVESLSAHAELEASREAVVLSPLVVGKPGLELRAKLRFAAPGPRGALFARLGPLAVGLSLAGGRPRVEQIVGARRWFEQQTLQ
ncbi:MAG: hypothetical protein KBD01_07655 [Acidobacteria bacterium]|nr:hypothetical protein [Acidobacteriota bacterium]